MFLNVWVCCVIDALVFVFYGCGVQRVVYRVDRSKMYMCVCVGGVCVCVWV